MSKELASLYTPSPELMVELMTRIKRCCDVTHRLGGQMKSRLWRDWAYPCDCDNNLMSRLLNCF